MSSEEPDTRGPREQAYDEQIAPRMSEIIALCKDAGIPMFATFMLDGDMGCTTSQPQDDADANELCRSLMLVARHKRRPVGPLEETLIQFATAFDAEKAETWAAARRVDRYGRGDQ